jgi:hypothetical protein
MEESAVNTEEALAEVKDDENTGSRKLPTIQICGIVVLIATIVQYFILIYLAKKRRKRLQHIEARGKMLEGDFVGFNLTDETSMEQFLELSRRHWRDIMKNATTESPFSEDPDNMQNSIKNKSSRSIDTDSLSSESTPYSDDGGPFDPCMLVSEESTATNEILDSVTDII